jgi:superfamily II DNA or RNA helicase
VNSLCVSPQGRLYISQDVGDPKIIAAFNSCQSEGLLALAAIRQTNTLPPSLVFWRDFAGRYFNALCQLPAAEAKQIAPISAPSENELKEIAASIPPMLGAEYCSSEMLTQVWQTLDQWVHEKIEKFADGVRGFISQHLPLWSQVGRVCFHLAENKQDPAYPFAFLATYASKLGTNAKIQYQPLAHALQQYAGERNKSALANLLKPVYEASKCCGWAQELVASGDIYQPLAWTSRETYVFLQDIPQLEASGILVRLPNWWQKRPRPKVQVTIGNSKQKSFGKDSLLDFNIDVALAGEPLTAAEIAAILAAENGLVSLRGQWVEVDSTKLKEALEHWKKIKQNAANGELTFLEGMRLLAGANADLSNTDKFNDQEKSWAYVEAGDWLQKILQGLRDPESLATKKTHLPLKTTLRPYQQIGVNWLVFLSEFGLGACLADDMGLGKTIQILALLLTKKQQKNTLNLLLLPASLLANWKAELERFAPSLNAIYLHGSELPKNTLEKIAQNPSAALQPSDLVLTTYGMLLRQPWLKAVAWDLVILDEAQAIKNPASKQTQTAKELKSRSRIALTGTPVENRLGDLWSLFDFLCPGLLGSANRFKNFTNTLDQHQHNAYQPLRKLVQPYILRRLKTDKHIIKDLPDKTEVKRWCSLTKLQAGLYAKAVAELSKSLESSDGIKRRGLILSYLMRFKQICNHPSQYLGNNEYAAENSGKFAQLAEICEEIAARQEKVLIFTQFREMTSPLAAFLTTVFSQPGLILHGGTPVRQRKILVDQFQADNGPPFFVLSLKAAGIGLNLTAASHVIHFDRWWNPAVENQATDRAFRIGQHKNVLVHKFICQGTLEEKIDQMISNKIDLADGVLKGGSEPLLTELDDEKLLNLVALDIEKALF